MSIAKSFAIDNFFNGKEIIKKHPAVISLIKNYMTNNADALSTPLLEIVTFGATERQKFLRAYDIDTALWAAFSSTHEILKLGWETPNDPLSVALYLSYVHSGKKEFLEFLGVRYLTSLMYKYYTKNGSLNPGIMRFIVYAMKDGKPVMSSKYLLKTEGSAIGMVKAIIKTVTDEHLVRKYKNKDLNEDKVIIDVLLSLKTRLNLNMRGIRDLYDRYKHERMYEQGDIHTDTINISVENETIKLATLKAKIDEKVTDGLDTTLVRRTNNTMYFDYLKDIYSSDLKGVIGYCQYLLEFYLSKSDNISFENMKSNFVATVTRAKGLDNSYPENLMNEFQIRDRGFVRAFLRLHVVLIYDIIIKMS